MISLGIDVSVSLKEDRPGMLAAALGAIARAGINVDGYAEVEGILHVVAQDPTGARRALEDAGFPIRDERRVLLVPVADQPGATAGILTRVAAAGENVGFSYNATDNRIVIGAGDPDRIAELLLRQRERS